MFQVSAEKKYHNQSELIDDMLENMFTCMQELNLNPGKNTSLFNKTNVFKKLYLYRRPFDK